MGPKLFNANTYDEHVMKIRIVFDFDAFFVVELAKICVLVQVQSEVRCRRVLLVDIRQRVALKHQLGKFLLRTVEHDSCVRFIDDLCRVSQIHPNKKSS